MLIKTESNQSYAIGQVGRIFTKRVSRALNETPWYWSVLGLAWTAGPVTYIALNGGYYLGYGKTAAPEIFIYFFGYTVITAALAAVAKLIRHLVVIPKREAAEQQLLEAVDRLFLFYYSARNAYLSMYPPEERAVAAAWWNCRSALTPIEMLEQSLLDVSGDEELARAFKRVEFYRRQGFTDLIRDEANTHKDRIDACVDKLAPRFPGLAEQIKRRFEGGAPSIRYGQTRPPGFIERLIAMEEDDAPQVATADDVIAMIHLTLEFILGRKVVALHPEFRGYRRLDDARERFDYLLSEFRVQLRQRNGRMRALIMDIGSKDNMDLVQVTNASSRQLQSVLINLLKNDHSKEFGKRRYREIVMMDQQVHRTWRKLSEHEKNYNRIWRQDGNKLKKRLQVESAPGKRRNPLLIHESEITLTNQQKIQLARSIHHVLDDVVIRKRNLQGLLETDDGLVMLDMDDYKRLAGQLLHELDKVIDLTKPEEQLAVEASREADFGSIEPGLAAQTKLSWGRVMVEEVQQDRIQISHRLASFLVRYLNLPLGEAIIQHLVSEYGASREFLDELHKEEAGSIEIATDRLSSELLTLPKWDDIKKHKARK